jgi:hypothetical protein
VAQRGQCLPRQPSSYPALQVRRGKPGGIILVVLCQAEIPASPY